MRPEPIDTLVIGGGAAPVNSAGLKILGQEIRPLADLPGDRTTRPIAIGVGRPRAVPQ